jgi:hypothetical protein
MNTGSLTLHKRLPSLRIQARSLGYSAVSANRAGSQSTYKLRRLSLSSGCDGFPSEPMILRIPSTKIRTISIIQGCVPRTTIIGAWDAPYNCCCDKVGQPGLLMTNRCLPETVRFISSTALISRTIFSSTSLRTLALSELMASALNPDGETRFKVILSGSL